MNISKTKEHQPSEQFKRGSREESFALALLENKIKKEITQPDQVRRWQDSPHCPVCEGEIEEQPASRDMGLKYSDHLCIECDLEITNVHNTAVRW